MSDMKDYAMVNEVETLKGMELARITAVYRERFDIIRCDSGKK